MPIRTSDGRIISEAEAISTGQSGTVVRSSSRSSGGGRSSVQVTRRDDEGNVVDRFNIAPELVEEFQAGEELRERQINRASGGSIRPGEPVFFELEPDDPANEGRVFTRDVSRVGRDQFQATSFELSEETQQEIRRASNNRGRVQDRTIEQQLRDQRAAAPPTPERDIRTFQQTPGGTISAASPELARSTRRARFMENFVGDPVGAFLSPFSDASGALLGGKTQQTARIINTGTPLEQGAAVLGTIGLITFPRGTAAVSRAEQALLTQIPRGLPRLATGLGLGTGEAIVVSRVAETELQRTAPSELRPFLNDDDVFRAARRAETSAETNFIRSTLGAINPRFNQRNIDIFEQTARQELQAQGLTGSDLDLALQAQMFRRTSIEPGRNLATTLQAGRFAEVFGRSNLANLPANFAERSFAGRALVTGGRIAPAGFIEVRGELAGDRAVLGSDLPFIDRQQPFRSLVPDVSFRNGFSIQPRSRLGEDLLFGSLGGVTAGFLGGLVGAGASARPGAAGTTSRSVGRTANIIGNIADVSEPFTDLLAGPQGLGRVPVISLTPSLSNVPATARRGRTPSLTNVFSQAFTVAPSQAPVIVPAINPANTFVPSQVPSSPQARITPTPNPFVPSIVPSQVPSQVPAQVPPEVPPVVPVPAFPVSPQVPATAFNARFPPPIPLDLALGGSGRGRPQRSQTAFLNELRFVTGFFGGSSTPRRRTSRRSTSRQSRNTVNNPFRDLENLIGGGLF